jgi:hypothetical protein
VDDDAMPAYEQAYRELAKTTLAALSGVESVESAQKFINQVIPEIQRRERTIPEFYVGEFVQLFKDAAWEQRQADVLALELAVEEAKDEGKAAGVELTARLEAARHAGDNKEQHAVWREREVRLAVVQARVDLATARLDFVGIRRQAYNDLAAALGF